MAAKPKPKAEPKVEALIETVGSNDAVVETKGIEVELTDKFVGHTGIILDGHVLKFANGKATVHPITAKKLKEIGIVK